jgi:hypothetical protein
MLLLATHGRLEAQQAIACMLLQNICRTFAEPWQHQQQRLT